MREYLDSHYGNKEARQMLSDLSAVNTRFNEELKTLTPENADSKVFDLGIPLGILKSAGIENKRFKLYGNKIIKKAKEHGYKPEDLSDLPMAMQSPLFVFEGSHDGTFSILTEININGNNVLVSIATNKKNELDVNFVTSVYDIEGIKDSHGKSVVEIINEDKIRYSEKDKSLNYLSALGQTSATNKTTIDTTNIQKDIESAKEKVQNFKNPKVDDTFLRMQALWHGSPYSFKKFSTDHIGSGEGAQAFGYGLYFTELKDIAKWYAEKLKPDKYKENATINNLAKEALESANGDVAEALKYQQELLQEDWSDKKRVKGVIKVLETGKPLTEGKTNLYEVNVADGLNLMRWDQPLTDEQVTAIKDSFKEETGREFSEVYSTLSHGKRIWYGNNVYYGLKEEMGSSKAASEFLLNSGIDGIKYPAESTSRLSNGERGFNYVIFDDSIVNIENQTRFMFNRRGGSWNNSGYDAEANMSERAKEAVDNGMLPRVWLPKPLKNLVDLGLVNSKEWHHYKKRQENFYSPESFKDVVPSIKSDWSYDEKAVKKIVAEHKKKNETKKAIQEKIDAERKTHIDKAWKALTEFNKKFDSFSRESTKPVFGLVQKSEMNGKYGWFDSSGRSYNLPEYYSGIDYKTKKNLEKAKALESALYQAQNAPLYELELSKMGFSRDEIRAMRNSGMITQELMPKSFYDSVEQNKDYIKEQLAELDKLPYTSTEYRPSFNKSKEDFLTDEEKAARSDRHAYISEQGENFGDRYERRNAHEDNDYEYSKIAEERYDKAREEYFNSDERKEEAMQFNERKARAQEITDNLKDIAGIESEDVQFMATKDGEVYGFVTPEGVVYLDPDKMNANTPIHEFGHLWNSFVKKNNPELWKKGAGLIKQSKYWEEVNNNPAYADLSEERKIDEAMAMAIGDKGERVFNRGIGAQLLAWIKEFWNWIKGKAGIQDKNIEDMTLEDFTDRAVKELLSGENMRDIYNNKTVDKNNNKNNNNRRTTESEDESQRQKKIDAWKSIDPYSDNPNRNPNYSDTNISAEQFVKDNIVFGFATNGWEYEKGRPHPIGNHPGMVADMRIDVRGGELRTILGMPNVKVSAQRSVVKSNKSAEYYKNGQRPNVEVYNIDVGEKTYLVARIEAAAEAATTSGREGIIYANIENDGHLPVGTELALLEALESEYRKAYEKDKEHLGNLDDTFINFTTLEDVKRELRTKLSNRNKAGNNVTAEQFVEDNVTVTGTEGEFKTISVGKGDYAGTNANVIHYFSNEKYKLMTVNGIEINILNQGKIHPDLHSSGKIYSFKIQDKSNGKIYLVYGLRNSADGNLNSNRNGTVFVSVEDNYELPEGIEEALTNKLIDEFEKAVKRRPDIFAPLPANIRGNNDTRFQFAEKRAQEIEKTKNDILDKFKAAVSGKLKGKSVTIGTITESGKQFLSAISGLDFREYGSFELNPSDLIHIYNDHFGENEKDKSKNNPLTDEDIRDMVDVLYSPEKVLFLGKDKKTGLNLFAFLKPSKNGTYNLMEVYGNKGGKLTAKSYYNTKKDIDQRVMELQKENSLLPTPEAYSDVLSFSDAKIPQIFETAAEKEQKQQISDDVRFQLAGESELSGISLNSDENLEKGVQGNNFVKQENNSEKGANLLADITNEKGVIDYDKLEEVAGRIESGNATIARLNRQEEQGRSRGGRIAIEASMVAGREDSADRAGQSFNKSFSEIGDRQENALREYAQKRGVLFSIEDIEKRTDYKFPSGAEADVYLSKDGKNVIKIVNFRQYSESPLEYLDNRIALNNYLFEGTSYKVIGFTDVDGELNFVVEQPFINGENLNTFATTVENLKAQQKRVADYMKEKFDMLPLKFENYKSPTSFSNSNYIVEDLHLNNVKEGADGNLYFIDSVISLNEPNEDFNGVREYEPFGVYAVESKSNKIVSEQTVNGVPLLGDGNVADLIDESMKERLRYDQNDNTNC
ncbi:MAG: hypothetical protein LBN74_03000 [Prevotella sp.]|jgi:hypothetical protein|nr:hypothetical protein [Prevotella sp.]